MQTGFDNDATMHLAAVLTWPLVGALPTLDTHTHTHSTIIIYCMDEGSAVMWTPLPLSIPLKLRI